MSAQFWETLANAGTYSTYNSGTALASSASLTDVSPGGNTAGQAFTVPANALQNGQLWRFTASGIYSTTGTPTLLLGLYYGGIAGTALAATAATTTGTVTNATFNVSAMMRVVTTGTAGTVITQGSVVGIAGTTGTSVLLPATIAAPGTVAVDTSTAKIITLGAQWGTSSASNTLTCFNWAVELLN